MNSSRAPRLAIIVTHPIQYLVPLYRELASRMDIEVLYCHQQDAKGQAAAGFGVEFEWDTPLEEGYPYRWLRNTARHPGLGSYWGTNAPELATTISKECFDAVWVNGWNHRCYQQATFHGRRHGLPVLCRGDSQLGMTGSQWKRGVKKIVYPGALRRYAAHLTVGQRNREYLRHYGVPRNRLFPMPHFVDTEYFSSSAVVERAAGARERLRREWKLADGDFIFLFVGKMIPKKRPLDFIRACMNLANRAVEDRVRAVLVGDGPMRACLEKAAADSEGRVVFAGFRNQSELPACYVAADALVLPSEASETWGLVVNEAMACGLPVIASDAVGCVPDMVEDGFTGFSYPVGNIERLENSMVELIALLKDRDLSPGLEETTRRHSVTSAADGLQQALNSIAMTFGL